MRLSRRIIVPLTAVGLGLLLSGPLASQTKTAPSTKTAAKKPPRNPREIRILLMDGSIVLGELSVDAIEVKTEFGTLTVPVEKILAITPGLDSHRELSSKITRLIRELGDDDYKKREAAQKDLLAMGAAIKDVVAEHKDDKNAERQRRVKEIVAKLEEMNAADFSFESTNRKKTWNRSDTVVTPNFTVVGDVSPSVFEVRSRYGSLKIGLTDIRRTEQTGLEKEATVKTVTVAGTYFHLYRPLITPIRVKAGDSVNVAASGTLLMTPWGSAARSTPDGNFSYGSDTIAGQRLGYGALVARVGTSGNWIKIGSRARFKAPATGPLSFAIIMRSTYSRGNYSFPGSYKVRVKVDPKD